MAHPKHQQVRQRYGYRCGYCGVSEVDTGGELTVDHYHPVVAGGDDNDDNLVYACYRCNQYKADFYPDSADIAHGHRLLHPLRDNLAAHIREDLSARLVPQTETGRFHIAVLRLNRPELVEHRRQKQAQELQREREQQLSVLMEQLKAAIFELEALRSRLQTVLNLLSGEEDI